MRWPARTIWDTRIQAVCGIISVRAGSDVEIYMTASFAQVTLSPPRIAINPNRLYPIEPLLRDARRFAVNVMPADASEEVSRAIRVRRREPQKPQALNIAIAEDAHGIPFLPHAMRTIFCELEQVLDTGDHTLMIARVIESRRHSTSSSLPVLYPQVAGPSLSFRRARAALRTLVGMTGALDLIKRMLHRRRPQSPPDIARATYEDGGQTEKEIAEITAYGLVDKGRTIYPPAPGRAPAKSVGVCVVGTSWGSFHSQLIKKAVPSARLFICGRDRDRTTRLAHAVGAEGHFIGLDAALNDPRIEAVSLALPHDLHRAAVEHAARTGKHALVEKPIATRLDDADAMIGAARQAGTILMVAEDMHFRPAIREASRRIASGDVGEPLYCLIQAGGIRRPRGWAAERERMGGGVLMDIGVHYVRALRLLLGEPDEVFASAAMQVDTKIGGEDSVQVIFTSRFGWQAHLLCSWATNRGHLPDIVIAGDRGTLHLWPRAHHLDLYPAHVPDEDILSRVVSRVVPAMLRPDPGRARKIEVPGSDPTGYEGEMIEFLSAVAEGREPASPATDGRRDVEIVLSAYRALEESGRVSIPPFQASDPQIR